MSLLDFYDASADYPAGLPRDTDMTSMVTGRLLGLDPEHGLAQVSIGGSDGVWVPAQPSIYAPGGAVFVQRSPLDGGRAVACLGPTTGAPMFAGGVVVAVQASVGLLTVDVLDSRVDLPYSPGTYNVGTTVHVLRNPARLGLPEYVLGPSGAYNHQNPGQPGGGSSGGGVSLVTRRATILPQWTGSWRASYSRWDTWNTSRYGGRSSLWQGNGYGSGPMTGLAVYGDQIMNLGAASIDAITVALYRADSSVSSGKVPVVQPSPNGSKPGGAPSVAGATIAGPSLAPGQGATVALPGSVLEGFRTGAYKGLATVGTDYAAFSGTPDKAPVHADGMALVVTYKVAG